MLLNQPSFLPLILNILVDDSEPNQKNRLKAVKVVGGLSLSNEGKEKIRSESILTTLLNLLQATSSSSYASPAIVNLLGSGPVPGAESEKSEEEDESSLDVILRSEIVSALVVLSLSGTLSAMFFSFSAKKKIIWLFACLTFFRAKPKASLPIRGQSSNYSQLYSQHFARTNREERQFLG